jgi:nickel/cobalt exporter
MSHRRRTLAVVAGVLALFLAPALALAHPLGNFTINHHSALRVSSDRVVVDQVIDMAEVPTFQERGAIDADGDENLSEAELAAYEARRCGSLSSDLRLTVGGRILPLAATGSAVRFPVGQLGQPTLRLVCEFTADLPVPLSAGTPLEFVDGSFPKRLGWREIVAAGDGVTLSGEVPSASATRRLTAYPEDLLASPLDRSSISVEASPGGPSLPPTRAPELGAPPDPADLAPAIVPGGVELGPALTAIFQADALTAPIVLAALAIAAGLGALHALTPGHGKTIMAAYLVGTRGDLPQAIGLGLTVAVSHTLGVLLLGLVTTAAASILPPDRINPILSLASGLLVLGIGLWLLVGILRQAGAARSADRAHRHAHAEGGPHGHGDAQEHIRHGQHANADLPLGEHSHGTVRHSHLPSQPAALRWRGIFTLGLAGGLVPSTAALFLLLGSVSLGRPAYGLVLIVAFGLGMALVMAAVGVALVHARRLVDRLPGVARRPRLAGLASTAAAFFVLGAGAWLTSQAVLGIRL